jgi:hypothetical protein
VTKLKVRLKLEPHGTINDLLAFAAERACNRHDKYADKPLSEASRALLINEFEASFWMAVSDRNLEFTR